MESIGDPSCPLRAGWDGQDERYMPWTRNLNASQTSISTFPSRPNITTSGRQNVCRTPTVRTAHESAQRYDATVGVPTGLDRTGDATMRVRRNGRHSSVMISNEPTAAPVIASAGPDASASEPTANAPTA
jgi:hypothetical protein